MPKITLPQLNSAYLKDFIKKVVRIKPPAISTATIFTGTNVDGTIGSGGSDPDGLYAPLTSSYVVIAADATLPNERILTAGAGISVTDAGAGGNVTIASTVADANTVMVTAADTTPNYLVAKITAGDGIAKTVLLPGGNESLSLSAEWKDDGSNTLIPVTANDNVYVETNQTPGLHVKVGASGLGGTAYAIRGEGAADGGVLGVSDTGSGIVGISNNNGVVGTSNAIADRTSEQYSVYANNRTYLGTLADILEAAAPEDAPNGRVRLYVCDDPRAFDMLYQVRDTGQTSPCANGIDYGDGSDGDVTLGGATTLTRNMFYKNLTVNAGAFVVNTAGYQIFVREKLLNNGTISCDGNAGTNGANAIAAGLGAGGAGGSARADAYLCGSGASAGSGGNGGAGGGMPVPPPGTGTAGTAGGARTVAFMSTGGAAGGNASAGAVLGGAGGAATAITAAQGMPRNAVQATRWEVKGQTMFYTNAASGGGAGGNGGAAGAPGAMGGGGGGGGGAGGNAGGLFICARWLVNNGTIQAVGGAGGNGGNGGNGTVGRANGGDGGGGGAGGQGGIIAIITEYYSGTSAFPTAGTNCAGGAAGALGTGGTGNAGGVNGTDGLAGAAGNAGDVIDLRN